MLTIRPEDGRLGVVLLQSSPVVLVGLRLGLAHQSRIGQAVGAEDFKQERTDDIGMGHPCPAEEFPRPLMDRRSS